MNYTLHQLRIFLEVANTLSITKASEELHLTQPAVSIQLKNFQNQFELPLFEVINKRIYITDFGREIASAADNILAEVHAINYKMNAHKGELAGRLKMSVVSSGKYVAPFFLADFIKINPGIDLVIDVTNKAQVLMSLEQNEVDFSLVSVLPETISLEKLELMENKLFLVGNKEMEVNKKEYPKDVFEKLPMIYREKGSGTRHIMERYIKDNNLPIKKKMELTSNEAVKQAVIAGLGCSIMPLIGIKNELQNQELKIIPVEGFPIRSIWYLIWLKDKKLSPIAEEYITYLNSNKEMIIQRKFGWIEKY